MKSSNGFKNEMRDPLLRRELAVVYAVENYLVDPPTVESLQEPEQPHDPRYVMRSRPHRFLPGKLIQPPHIPQGVLPPFRTT